METQTRAARLALTMAARIAPVLLLPASSALALYDTAFIEVIPPYPTTTGTLTLRVFGIWHDACTPENPVLSQTGHGFRVDTSSSGEICAQVLTGFEMFVPLGNLVAGYYSAAIFYAYAGPREPSLIGSDTFAVLEDTPTEFYTLKPCRLLDTRNPVGPTGGPALAAGSIRTFPISGGECGIPSTAVAVSVNLTAVGATGPGYLTLFPGDALSPPPTSNLNFAPAVTRAGNAVVLLALDGAGTIKVKNGSAGAAHFVLDVNGYFQ
jgi:hypothetical protein